MPKQVRASASGGRIRRAEREPHTPVPGRSWWDWQQSVEKAREAAEKEYQQIWNRTKQTDEGRRHWSPWLLIRYTGIDLGARPIPSGDVFWESPDVWVESSDPMGNPVAGEENFVHARVFNLGAADAAPVKVDFYWANPALGLGPGNMNLIGTEWVEVFSLTATDVRCRKPWIPLMLNDGHECLVVNCSNHVLDPILHPFAPTLDRHVGQRNVHVVTAPAGKTLRFSLQVNNLFPLVAAAQISARVEHVPLNIVGQGNVREGLARALMHGNPQTNTKGELTHRFRRGTPEHRTALRVARNAPSSAAQETAVQADWLSPQASMSVVSVSSQFEDKSSIQVGNDARIFTEMLLARDTLTSQAISLSGLVLEQFQFKPFEQRTVILTLAAAATAHIGDYVVLRLSQTIQGILVGGYSIVIKVAARG